MDHLANNIAELCHVVGRTGMYAGGVPLIDSPVDEFVPVIVFENLDLSVCQ